MRRLCCICAAVAAVLVVVLGASCSSSTASCTVANCNGCCDDTGTCVGGTSPLACGAGGLQCTGCVAGQSCNSGACVDTGTGGGSSGTGGGSGGGSASGLCQSCLAR